MHFINFACREKAFHEFENKFESESLFFIYLFPETRHTQIAQSFQVLDACASSIDFFES